MFLTVCSAITEIEIVMAISVDLCNAINAVDHDLLLYKVYNCGVRGNLFSSFKHYYAPPLIGRGIKRCFCLTSDVCLSRTSGLTREHRPRKTKIGTEIVHVTHDSYTTFKIKRLKVKVTRPLFSPRP